MTYTTEPPPPSRLRFLKILRVGLAACWVIMAGWVVLFATAGRSSSGSIIAFIGAVTCLAAVLGVLFQGLQKQARDRSYTLAGKRVALALALGVASCLLIALAVLLY